MAGTNETDHIPRNPEVSMKDKFKIALCQMMVTDNKEANIRKAEEMLAQASEGGADIAVLPEMFNCPYSRKKFHEFAEVGAGGATIKAISNSAGKLGLYVVAGTIPEIDEGTIYNTCFVFDRRGNILGRHRKMHLFDVDIPGKIRVKESETFSAGTEVTVVDTDFCKLGVEVCYDMRFPELSRLAALKGAALIVVPAAFNMVTGPAHWELLVRSRALDNQVYFAAVSPARDNNASYVVYGHSMVASPWGDIISKADEKEYVLFSDIDLGLLERIRNELPLLRQRRTDIYDVVEKDDG
jgi:omega-amidase